YNGEELRTNINGKPPRAWDVEVNIMIDYRTDFTWSNIKLEFDNDMGISNATANRIKLERAYIGGRIISSDTLTLDAELGRRFLSVYDSKLQYGCRFDGLLLRLSKAFENVGDFYATPSVIIVNDKFDHYAYAAEIGALQIANTNLYIKGSAVYWYKDTSKILPNQSRYCVAQILPAYQFYPEWFNKRLIKFYGAALCNVMAQRLRLPVADPANPDTAVLVDGKQVWKYFSRQNWGWYIGAALGTVKKAGDWAVEGNFQWLQAQAVPDFDASGIGRGNSRQAGLFLVNQDRSPTLDNLTTTQNAAGNGNYYGFELDALYAFTSNLTMEQNVKLSWTLDKDIGPNINYRQWEIEFIYAF
ncbi:MAG: hypothetical protein K2X08_01685, partial [Chlamydiales bacterium]|nr:hypothetical protein [Chlamydiales bacterium]